MTTSEAQEVLGVEAGASAEVVRQAYLDLVFVWHPDRFGRNDRLRAKAEAHLKLVVLAYEHLESIGFDTGDAEAAEFGTAGFSFGEEVVEEDYAEEPGSADGGDGAADSADIGHGDTAPLRRRAFAGLLVVAVVGAVAGALYHSGVLTLRADPRSGEASTDAVAPSTPTSSSVPESVVQVPDIVDRADEPGSGARVYRLRFPDGTVKIVRSNVPLTEEELSQVARQLMADGTGGSKLADAARRTGAEPVAFTNEKGQITCPVMGTVIESRDKAVGYQDHEGMRYYFCCEGCPEQFRSNPEKYAKREEAPDGATAEPVAFTNDKGQIICPVMGSVIESKDKAVSYQDHEGMRYYFCCDGCPDQFKNDPEKYAKKGSTEESGDAAGAGGDTGA